jgi:hypothetical protein
MSLNTSAVGQGQGSTEFYGHADYYRDKAAGLSDSELLAKIHADPSKMGNGGIGGDLYNQIKAGANSGGGGGGGYSGGGGGGYTPPSPGGTVGREGFRKAYGEEFQENLAEATKAYDQDESKMGNLGGTSHDFRRGVKQEQAIKDNDPFNDSWDSRDFFGKYMTMFREGQKGRGDGTAIANKYIFNAAQTNPVNIQALDQQIRTNPLYSEAKAELANLNTFGDRYKTKGQTQPWMNPQAPSVYEPPDLQGISSDYMDKIDDIKL